MATSLTLSPPALLPSAPFVPFTPSGALLARPNRTQSTSACVHRLCVRANGNGGVDGPTGVQHTPTHCSGASARTGLVRLECPANPSTFVAGQASSAVETCYNDKGDMVKHGEQYIPMGIDTCTQVGLGDGTGGHFGVRQ